MTSEEFSKLNVGDEITIFTETYDKSFKIKEPYIIKSFFYKFPNSAPTESKNNLGVPLEVDGFGVLLPAIYDDSIVNKFNVGFKELYKQTGCVPVNHNFILDVIIKKALIDRSKFLAEINKYRFKKAQNSLDDSNWSDEDILIEYKRLGFK